MSFEEFIFSEKKIVIEKREKISSSYKIKSYNVKLKFMEERKIPQRDINDVLAHFFNTNKTISKKTKNSISKIIYSQKDRILIIITHSGKDIIVNRDRLIRDYGWFFFVEKSEKKEKDLKKKKPKKKEERKEEKTLSTEEFPFDDTIVLLKEKVNMRSLYRTKEYDHYLKLIKSGDISQLPVKDVLNDLFFKDETIPLGEKKGIRKIIYYQKERVIVIKSLIGDELYENLERLVKKKRMVLLHYWSSSWEK